MGQSFAAWFTGMGEFSKALRSVGIIITITIAATLLLASFKGIPAQIANHEARIQVLEDSADKLDRIICMLSQSDTLTSFQLERICR